MGMHRAEDNIDEGDEGASSESGGGIVLEGVGATEQSVEEIEVSVDQSGGDGDRFDGTVDFSAIQV